MRIAQLVAEGYSLLFAASVLGKLDSWKYWAESVGEWLPSSMPQAIIRLGLPLTEGCVAIVLLLQPAFGLVAASALLTVLGLGVLVLARRRRGLDCGCFGSITQSTIGPRLAIQNLSLAVFSALIASVAADSQVRTVPAVDLLFLLVVAVVAALVIEARKIKTLSQRSAMTKEGA